MSTIGTNHYMLQKQRQLKITKEMNNMRKCSQLPDMSNAYADQLMT